MQCNNTIIKLSITHCMWSIISEEFLEKAVETAELCVVSGAGGSVWNNYFNCNAQVGGIVAQWVVSPPHNSRGRGSILSSGYCLCGALPVLLVSMWVSCGLSGFL